MSGTRDTCTCLTTTLDAALRSGAVVLTPTARLARELRLAWNERRAREAPGGAWPTPDVQTLEGFLSSLVRYAIVRDLGLASRRPRRVLGALEERVLWERLIAADAGAGVRRPDLAADAAMRAHAVMRTWDMTARVYAAAGAEDTGAFVRWHRDVLRRCEADGAIDGATAAREVLDLVRAGLLPLPARVVFAADDGEWSPLRSLLADALGAAGVTVEGAASPVRPAVLRFRTAESPDDELRSVAAEARDILRLQPDARIGVIVPDLRERRAAVERIFADVLDPAANHEVGDALSHMVDLSLGVPLRHVPLIVLALRALDLLRERIPAVSVSAVLLSPAIAAGDHELDARAVLDARIRERCGEELTRPLLRRMLAPAAGCARLLARLDAMPEARGTALPSEWATLFDRTLHALAWASLRNGDGTEPLDSGEFQAVRRFGRVLAELVTLDSVTGRVPLGDALTLLRTACGNAVFQPEATGAPVQVLGVHESEGLAFTHAFVLGMTADAWPPPPRPAAFLPLGVQRDAGIPDASPEASLARARRATARLRGIADDITVCCARTDGDSELLPSPLWADLSAAPFDDGLDRRGYSELLMEDEPGLEWVEDSAAPPLAGGGSGGGTSVLTLQSACPFRAFAELRLHARPVLDASAGITPMERGAIVHDALRAFWEETRDAATLAALTPDERAGRIRAAVDAAVDAHARSTPRADGDTLLDVERRRLNRLLASWLDLEAQREPFTVEAIEHEVTLDVGPLHLRGRVDRVDLLERGERVLIDYKTGTQGWRAWTGDRPEEPQLPAYALYAGMDVEAIAFALVRRDQMSKGGFSGLGVRDGMLPGVQTPDADSGRTAPRLEMDWNALCASWDANLLRLAVAYAQGDARVDPVHPVNTCAWCRQHAFCRILERGPDEEDRLETDDGDAGGIDD